MLSALQCITLTDINFEAEVLEATMPVIVNCWATWCHFNPMVNPIVHPLAASYSEPVKVGRLNIAEFDHIAVRYGVRAVPTLLIFWNGHVVEQMVGSVSQATIVHTLNSLLSNRDLSQSSVPQL